MAKLKKVPENANKSLPGKTKKKSKKKGKPNPETSESEPDFSVQNELDPQEISDLVKQLGLDKFRDDVTASKPSAFAKNKDVGKSLKVNEGKVQKPKAKATTLPKVEAKSATPPIVVERSSRAGKKKNKPGQKNEKTGSEEKAVPKKLTMIVQPGGKWFLDDDAETNSQEGKNESTGTVKNTKPFHAEDMGALRNKANELLEADIQTYKAVNMRSGKKSDFQWMEKIMKSGTVPDRMAAFIVRIQDSPIHNLNYLQHLISMVKVQGKQQCIITADTVRDLFLEDLLPPDRKLISFESRGEELLDAKKKQLIQFIFEDKLKSYYNNYIEALKRMAGDTVEKLRGKAINIVYQLLVAHPEQETVLLQIIVNKLGDPAKKLGSRALFYLKKLLDEHPQMKLVVIEEVERLLFRNNIAQKAQYYGICFLNLIRLEGEHASLAYKLIGVYLAFFKACVKTGDIDTKMMSGLLTGINRAFPQAREYGFQFTESLDTLYKIVQLSQFTIGVQALCILFQVIDVEANPSGADRVLYAKLLAPEFLTTAHNLQFLNLIFKAMKTDNNVDRVVGFTKRLLQICQNVSANLACAILFLISEVSKVHPGIVKVGELSVTERKEAEAEAIIDPSDSDNDSENEESELKNRKNKLDLDLLMKSSNIRISKEHTPAEESARESTAIHHSQPPKSIVFGMKDKKTSFVDLTDDASIENTAGDVKPNAKPVLTEYDPLARNPSFCGAQCTLSHELTSLARHFHPSVALFAQTLISKKSIVYDGNPLKDFTVARFLERFVYRNAKTKKDRPIYQPQGLRNVPVNSSDYIQAGEDKIPVEEKFFYKFFKTKKEDKAMKSEQDQDDDASDAESIDDDEFDSLMDNYFKSAKGADSDDEDLDEEEIDFASGVSIKKKSKKRKLQDEESEDEDEDLDKESEEDDDVDDFIDMDGEDEVGFDSEDDEGMFEDDDDMMIPTNAMSKRKAMSKSMKGTDMFAPAEQFSEMLEANAEESLAGSQTLINKDRADPKQLKWEVERDRWVKGYTGSSKAQYKGSKKKKTKRK